MNIFLTGATGFIGKNFLSLALKKKHFIYAVARKKQILKHKNLKWLIGSLDKNWSNELKASNVLVHLASDGVINKKISYHEAKEFNVTKSISLFKNAVKNNCKNWVVAGSMSEYGANCSKIKKLSIRTIPKPKTNYEKTKYIFSKKIILLSKKTQSKCRIMRIFHVFGDGECKKRLYPSLINAAKKNKDFVIKNGNEVRDFVDVKFVSKALLDSCNFKKRKFNSYQIWHIASGKAMNIKTFAKKVWKKYKSKARLKFNKQNIKTINNFVSDKKSIWRV